MRDCCQFCSGDGAVLGEVLLVCCWLSGTGGGGRGKNGGEAMGAAAVASGGDGGSCSSGGGVDGGVVVGELWGRQPCKSCSSPIFFCCALSFIFHISHRAVFSISLLYFFRFLRVSDFFHLFDFFPSI